MKWLSRSQIAIIIGCLNLITYLVVCVVLTENVKYDRYSHYDYDDYNDVYKSYELREQARVQREFYCMIYVTMCIIQVIFSGLLIWGVLKKRSSFITPWLLASFVVLIYSSIEVLDDIFIKSSFHGVQNAVIFFIILFVVFGIQIFCLVMVYSVYKSCELEIVLQRFLQQTDSSFEVELRKRSRTSEATDCSPEEAHQIKSKKKKYKTNKSNKKWK